MKYKEYLDCINVDDILKNKAYQKKIFGNQKGKMEFKVREN